MATATRTCRGCGYDLPLAAFHKDPRAADGLRRHCRGCRAVYRREYRDRMLAQRAGTPATHRCTRCGKRRRAAAFSVDVYTPTGLSSWCSSCEHETRVTAVRSPRRDRLADSEVFELTARQWARILLQHGGIGTGGARCWACQRWCDDPTVDHVLPLARGGTHSAGNVAPACSACNSSRSDRLVSEVRFASRYADRRVSQRLRATGRGPRTTDRNGHGLLP